jgi:Mg-chelatase subunit ChlD
MSKLTPRGRGALVLGLGALLLLVPGCKPSGAKREAGAPRDRAGATEPSSAPYQAAVEEGLGAAVAILVDTSGSMREKPSGDNRPKYVIARESLETMLDTTEAFSRKRPDFPIKIGLYSFSSSAQTLRGIQPYDRDALRAALQDLPRPGGGTAIGEAMHTARPDLYRAGVFRKYLLVVTDGENTNGPPPERVAREIWQKSEGAVQIYFVAFDTSPGKFAFLKEVGGDVIAAGTGAELRSALDEIYTGKILAEAVDAGEREPAKK